jgi:HTH-type transcriptional regulator, sugar sensing transcriptional regulator
MTLIDKLQESGLTKREALVYLALLQKKEFAASEIASIVPIGRTKIYEILPSIISKGLCSEIQKNGKKIYRAVEPAVALQNLLNFFKREHEEIFHKKELLITDLKDELSGIYDTNADKTDSLDYIEVLKDLNQIKKRWIELQRNIKYEMLAFNKPPYIVNLNQNVKHEKKVFKRKIKGQGIYEFKGYDSPGEREQFFRVLEEFTSLGEECRVIENLPMKMMVMDERITMLALNDPVSMKPSTTTMIVAHPGYALAHKEVFNSFWNKAVPVKQFKNKFK